MHMIALGWLWVVFMMAITEKNLVAGVMTFVFYGLVPTALFLYALRRTAGKRISVHEWQRAREAAAKEDGAPAPDSDAQSPAPPAPGQAKLDNDRPH
jgi:hypothetical protein